MATAWRPYAGAGRRVALRWVPPPPRLAKAAASAPFLPTRPIPLALSHSQQQQAAAAAPLSTAAPFAAAFRRSHRTTRRLLAPQAPPPRAPRCRPARHVNRPEVRPIGRFPLRRRSPGSAATHVAMASPALPPSLPPFARTMPALPLRILCAPPCLAVARKCPHASMPRHRVVRNAGGA